MERNGKCDEKCFANNGNFIANCFEASFGGRKHLILTGVVEGKYTTPVQGLYLLQTLN